MDIKGIVDFSVENKLDLVVVSPDDPLAGHGGCSAGCRNKSFGPVKDAAIIESSKSFSKNLMKKYGIPTAEYDIYDNPDDALKSLRHRKYPLVIKADGLAAGKGVIIAQTYDIAAKAIHDIMRNRIFGEAGNKVILEEFLTGMEVTVLSFTDGKTLVPMVSSQDHKKAYDYDKGPNTGNGCIFT